MAKTFVCTPDAPVVETAAGKLHGMIEDGVYEFLGIPYGKAKRFHLPEPADAWDGVRDALCCGYVCPLLNQDRPGPGEQMVPHCYWPMDEDCLNLNVWTPGIKKDAKRPVMFWIHGGGLVAGSSIEQKAYNGLNMALLGDVVVVSVNHRLNVLGYMDLSAFGEEYKNSGQAGQADLILALKWVRDNIEAFGGDPDNVTVFGQSGGGMKITMLLQSPQAEGLFHKAIIESGIMERIKPASGQNSGKRMAELMMQELGISDVHELETVPFHALAAAANKASVQAKEEKWWQVLSNTAIPGDWYLGNPVEIGFSDFAKTIPMMVGTCIGEFGAFPLMTMRKGGETKEDYLSLLYDMYGKEKAEKLIELFGEAYPDKEAYTLLGIDQVMRIPTRNYIEKRIEDHCAPTYSFIMGLNFDFRGGLGAWHCSEVPYVFHNTQMVPASLVEGVTEKLQEQIFGAWMAFAHTGDPNHALLPDWQPCQKDEERVMVFDRNCEEKVNFDHALYEELPRILTFVPPKDTQH